MLSHQQLKLLRRIYAFPGQYLLTLFIGIAVLVVTFSPADSHATQRTSVLAPLAVKSLLLAGSAKEGMMTVVGERGHILASKDNGSTWSQVLAPTRALLNNVYFHDQSLGWAIGHEETVLRTVDGGKNWEIVNHNPEKEDTPLFDIWFKDAKNGFIVGAYGTFLVTADGGLTWNFQDFMPVSVDSENEMEDDGENAENAENVYSKDDEEYYEDDLPLDFHLNHIAEAADGRLYVAAEMGNLFRSDDGGETWISLVMPYPGSFFGSLPLDGDTLLVYGLQGNMFRSEDAGETWQQIETGVQAMLTDGCRLSDGTVVVVGLGGTVLVSSDEGRTFSLKKIIGRQDVSALFESDDKALIMTGTFGVKKFPLSTLGN
jgi:photosystem II stability/assembly factor-like uncharacterized protein